MKDFTEKALLDHNVDTVNGVIHINGDVDGELYDKLVHDIAIIERGNPDALDKLTVYLTTYGGDVYFGFAIYDFLKLVTNNLKIVCSGPVMSAGTIILQAADDRAMMPNAYLLVHFGLEVNDNQQSRHHHSEVDKKIKKLLVDRCNAKEQTVKKWFAKESYFDKRRAKDVGLVDRIVGE